MKPHLIVNPASASGRTGRHFDSIARAVRATIGEFEWSFTRWQGHAAAIAREVVQAGARFVVAVGGDGTASEVIDGLSEGGAGRVSVTFGYIPRGTGGDFRRTLGWPADSGEAVLLLSSGADRNIDLGRVEMVGHDGRPHVRHFVNVSSFGISARVVQHVDRIGKKLGIGGKAAFMLGSARSLIGWQDQPVRWRVDGGPWRQDRITGLSVCNGRYFGGGMMVAPDAVVDDGLFDVTVWNGLGISDFVTKRSMLYDGQHVRLPNTERLRGRTIEAEPLDGAEVLVEVDGEQPGMLPARFTMIPGALRARIPRDPSWA